MIKKNLMSKRYSFIKGYTEGTLKNKREILSDNSYITWLIEILKKHDVITDEECQFYDKTLSEEDIRNIKRLDTFFGIISDYYEYNLIEGSYSKENSTICFIICYRKTYFKIGLCVGQGAFNFASRIDANSCAIKFKDILNGKTSEEREKKLRNLYFVEQNLRDAKKSQIPYNSVINILEKIYSEEE